MLQIRGELSAGFGSISAGADRKGYFAFADGNADFGSFQVTVPTQLCIDIISDQYVSFDVQVTRCTPPRRRQKIASMFDGCAVFNKGAPRRIRLVVAEVDTLDAQRLNRCGNGAMTVFVNLHPEPDAKPTNLDHAAPEG